MSLNLTLKPQIVWYLTIGDSKERQFLYYAERPAGFFVEGKAVPTYNKITIEMPTRLMESTQKWLDSKDKTNMRLDWYDQIEGKVVESWTLKNVKKIAHFESRSKVMDQRVMKLIISHEGFNA